MVHKALLMPVDALTYRQRAFLRHKLQLWRWPIRWWHSGIQMVCSTVLNNQYNFSSLLLWSTHSLYSGIVWLLWLFHGCLIHSPEYLIHVLKVNYMFILINATNYIWDWGNNNFSVYWNMHNYAWYMFITIMFLLILVNEICRIIFYLYTERRSCPNANGENQQKDNIACCPMKHYENVSSCKRYISKPFELITIFYSFIRLSMLKNKWYGW